MRPTTPPTPVMGGLIAAINDGNRDTFAATFSPDTPLTDHRSRTRARSGWREARGSRWATQPALPRQEQADGGEVAIPPTTAAAVIVVSVPLTLSCGSTPGVVRHKQRNGGLGAAGPHRETRTSCHRPPLRLRLLPLAWPGALSPM
jgi:hypothetical protein